MKATPHFGNSVINLPASVLKLLPSAPKFGADILIYILGNDSYSVSEISGVLSISEDTVLSALRFWEKNGVITNEIIPERCKTTKSDLPDVVPAEKIHGKVSSSLPVYTSEETARLLETRVEAAALIDSCEQLIGKIFTTAETNIILGMLDHLSLSADYILLLFAHASKIGKNSVRYIEKLAISLSDRDVIRYDELAEELTAAEQVETTSAFVKNLFGFGKRALTKKEKDMVRTWSVDWDYSDEIIEKAYEITADNTGNASMPYANAVLERWHAEGLNTLEDIEKNIEKSAKTKKKTGKKRAGEKERNASTSSFDTDDFFEAALRRSYGDGGKDK